jgi:formylglycine-generating enzyme required for sulfatase activity
VPPQEALTDTEKFTAYMEELIAMQVLSFEQLERFQAGLQDGRIINPLRLDFMPSHTLIHATVIQDHLDGDQLNIKKLKIWVAEKLGSLSTTQVERIETEKETQNPWSQVEFVTVPGGSFERWVRESENAESKKVKIEIPSFETMSTHVTQGMWLFVMGDLPRPVDSKVDGVTSESETHVIHYKGRDIEFRPDEPIVNVSWWSALAFANKLSELHGLKPAYPLETLKFDSESSAAYGTLAIDQSKYRSPHGPNLKNFFKGISQAEGYRLPSVIEKVYLFSQLGFISKENLAHETYANNIKIDPNFLQNRKGRPGKLYPVGSTPESPKLSGKYIHDIFGNSWELLADGYSGTTSSYSSYVDYSLLPLDTLIYPITNEKRTYMRYELPLQDPPPGEENNVTLFTHIHAHHTRAFVSFRLSRTLPKK